MAPSGRFIPRAAPRFMGRMNLGCCSSLGPAPSANAASLAIRLWDRRVPTHPSLSSLSGSWWSSSISRSPSGRRPRGDTGCAELTPAQLKRELRRIAWGHVRLAQKLGVWPSEVRDWLTGKEAVPELVASDIRDLPSHNLRPPRPA